MKKTTYKDYWESLSPDEKKYSLSLFSKIEKMRELRENKYKQFNNLTYSERYDMNREIGLGYNDLSVFLQSNNADKQLIEASNMSATTPRNKVTAELSHLLQFKYEPDVEAYDKENQLVEHLGENLEHLVVKSREFEKWDEKKIEIYKEFLEQGNVFVMEVFTKVSKVIHDNGGWIVGDRIKDYAPDANSLVKYDMLLESKLFPSKNIYLSNLRQRDIQKQPTVVAYEEVDMDSAKKRFGSWDRWEYIEGMRDIKIGDAQRINNLVKPTTNNGDYAMTDDQYYWSLTKPQDEVAILYVFDNINKTYQVIINGVLMLPVGYSLYEVSPSGMLPIAKGDAEIITGFAYSKGTIDNTITDSKMSDAVLKSMMSKIIQGAKPTMGNRSGRIIPKDLLYSQRLIAGLRAEMFDPLLPAEARTITDSDNTMYQLLKGVMSDKTVDDTFAGQGVNTDTATEYMQRQKNTIMKLFGIVLGIMNLEEQLIKLRIFSIMSEWTKPEIDSEFKEIYGKTPEGVYGVIGKEEKPTIVKKYRELLVENKLKRDGGKKGYVYIKFFGEDNKDILPQAGQENHYWDLLATENALSKKMGKQVRMEYLNAERLSQLFDFYFKVDVIPKKEDDSQLEAMSFVDMMGRTAGLFPDALNREGVLREVAEKLDQDPEKIFNLTLEASPQPMQDPSMQAGVQANPQGATMQNPLSKTIRPNLAM